MRLLAISDLHLANPKNMQALKELPPQPEDWLILAGDLCESRAVLSEGLDLLAGKFARLIWVPGNHELWTVAHDDKNLHGEAKYLAMVDICRKFGVTTPEDEFVTFETPQQSYTLVPLFLLYDYSFRPEQVSRAEATAWALEHGIECTDEHLLSHLPYSSKDDWCAKRCEDAFERLKAIPKSQSLILINHFPLRYDLVHIPRIPRFSLWCGTKRTENWHKEFNVGAVVYGHLHLRSTQWRDGVRFEEVSFGNPNQWDPRQGMSRYLRTILPIESGES